MRKLLLIFVIICITLCACSSNNILDEQDGRITVNQDEEENFNSHSICLDNADKEELESNTIESDEDRVNERDDVKADGFYVEALIDIFENLLVEAINDNDFNRITKYLSDNDDVHLLLQSQITEFNEQSKKVELISYDIDEIIENVDNDSYIVYVSRVWSVECPGMDNQMIEESKIYTVIYNGEVYVINNIEELETD